MATELNAEAVQVTTRATKITLAVLKDIINTLIENRSAITHGQQTLKKLNLQNKQLERVELSQRDIKAFRKELNKYSVDFSVMKDRETGNLNIFFKAQDVDRVYQGLQSCVKGFEKPEKKTPIKEVMKQAEIKSTERNSDRSEAEKPRSANREASR